MTQPRAAPVRNDRNGKSILKFSETVIRPANCLKTAVIWAKLKVISVVAPANYDLTDIDIPNIWHVGLNFDFCGVKPKSV